MPYCSVRLFNIQYPRFHDKERQARSSGMSCPSLWTSLSPSTCCVENRVLLAIQVFENRSQWGTGWI